MSFIDDFENMIEHEIDHIDNLYDMGQTEYWMENPAIDEDELLNAFHDYETNGVTNNG